MEISNIFWILPLYLFYILMAPHSTLSAPIRFMCNKTNEDGDSEKEFICNFDIHTDHQAADWKKSLNQFTFSINVITGVMLAMIVVIFISIIFNILRYRRGSKPHLGSSTSLVPQRRSEVIEINVKGSGAIVNNYETPIASGSGTKAVEDDDAYLKPEPVEENLYDQLEHEKELVKKGITTINVEASVYNEVVSEVVIDDNLYHAVEFKKTTAIDNAAYGSVDKPGDMLYNKLEYSKE